MLGPASLARFGLRLGQVSFSSSASPRSPSFCVVGGGPAGFYLAQHLVSKGPPDLRVDILERLPVPFGLVRFGVAPDHPDVKNVEATFTRTVERAKGRVGFFGNVRVGSGPEAVVSVDKLRHMYDGVVLAYGAEEDRRMGIPGEDTLSNVLSARDFVNMYNGVPDLGPSSDSINLSSCGETAAVVGVGNVALDVARVLLTPVDALRSTDISDEALSALSSSRVRRVVLVGRRGPLHVSFTIKELREMINLEGCVPYFDPADFAGVKEAVPALKRPRKRLADLMAKTALDPPTEKQAALRRGADRSWTLKLLRTPLEFLSEDGCKVSGMRMGVNRLVGEQLSESQGVESTGEEETLDCGLVLRSVGYRSVPVDDGVPFDGERGVVPNEGGRVTEAGGEDESSCPLYCAGWLATGPRGVIVDTMTEAFKVADAVLEDLAARDQVMTRADGGGGGTDELRSVLRESGCHPVDWAGWGRIDEEETRRGKERGKPRQKMATVGEMLEVANTARSSSSSPR